MPLKENSQINWWIVWFVLTLLFVSFFMGASYGAYKTARFAANQLQFLADRGYINIEVTDEMKSLFMDALTTYQAKAGGFIHNYQNASIHAN